jgi:hypothetical protein
MMSSLCPQMRAAAERIPAKAMQQEKMLVGFSLPQ